MACSASTIPQRRRSSRARRRRSASSAIADANAADTGVITLFGAMRSGTAKCWHGPHFVGPRKITPRTCSAIDPGASWRGGKWRKCARRPKKSACPALYTLTSICSVEYIKKVESVFEVIAEPTRRAILGLLVSSQRSVGEIERQLGMPQPAVSKHLRVLRDAGFVESTVDAQRRLYRLKPEPLQEVEAWLAPFRRFWSAHVDALERHLDRMDQSTPTKRKTRKRRRGPNRELDKGETK